MWRLRNPLRENAVFARVDAREWTALHDDVFSAERLKSPDRAVNDRLDPGCFRLPPTQVHQLLKAACWIRGWSYPKTTHTIHLCTFHTHI